MTDPSERPFSTPDLVKVLVGGGIGFFLALLGAWQGEGWMGNLGPTELAETTRGKLRASLWQEDEFGIPRPDRERDRTR